MLFRWKRFDKRRQNAHGFALFSSSFSRKHVSKKAVAMLKVGPSLSSQASRNVSGVSRSSLTGSSLILYLVFAFSAIQGPVKELRLSFMSGEKYMNKNISTSHTQLVAMPSRTTQPDLY